MLDEISELIKESMKAKNMNRLKALRYLKSLLLENKTSKSPIAEQDIIIKYYKKIKDSLELYKDSKDHLEDINAEMKVIAEFMPQQLSEEKVIAIIAEIKVSLENPNMGSIMKELSPKIKGQFDGKQASMLVRNSLA